MKWFAIITLTVLVLATINLLIVSLSQCCLFFQVLYAFICSHETWKRYRRLKKYLKTNTIPLINILDYEGNNSGFAFIQYGDTIFVIQGDNTYLSSYYKHLIKNLLKHNDYDTRRALQ
jgi:hypothetical protein